MGRDYPAEMKRWEELEAIARAALKQWEKEVARAINAGEPIPAKPDMANTPLKPIMPRASISDAAIHRQ